MTKPLREMTIGERADLYFDQFKQEQEAKKAKNGRSLRELLNGNGTYVQSNYSFTIESLAESAKTIKTDEEATRIRKEIFGTLDVVAEFIYSGQSHTHTIHESREKEVYSANLRYPLFAEAWLSTISVSDNGRVQIRFMHLKEKTNPNTLASDANRLYSALKSELENRMTVKSPESLGYSVESSRR